MILSNAEIQAALKARRLIIEPVPKPDFPDNAGNCPYATSAVDLRLGNEISNMPPPAEPAALWGMANQPINLERVVYR